MCRLPFDDALAGGGGRSVQSAAHECEINLGELWRFLEENKDTVLLGYAGSWVLKEHAVAVGQMARAPKDAPVSLEAGTGLTFECSVLKVAIQDEVLPCPSTTHHVEKGVRETSICASTASRLEEGISHVVGERDGHYLRVMEEQRVAHAEAEAEAKEILQRQRPVGAPVAAEAEKAAEEGPPTKRYRPRGANLVTALLSDAHQAAAGVAAMAEARVGRAPVAGTGTGARQKERADRVVAAYVDTAAKTRGEGGRRMAAADKAAVEQDLTVSSASLPNLQKITSRGLCIHKAIAELQHRGVDVDASASAAAVKQLLKPLEVQLQGCAGHFQWTLPAEELQQHDEREVVRKLVGKAAIVSAANARSVDASGNMEDIRTRVMDCIMGN